jgi:glycolate oxidase FAD binding subunit
MRRRSARQATQAGGHATLFRADDALKTAVGVFQPLTEPLARIHRNLKRAFDPQAVFNPGRLYPGL